MRFVWFCAALAAVALAGPVRAADTAEAVGKKAAKRYEVPYRLTVPKHVMVRAKINGKGPFNFILDTGAPALFVATKVCKKLGIKPDRKGWGTFDRFEIEGGVVLKKFPGRVETPFQLEGMNGMGLAGAELHGIIGYNILAHYRMEIDFTSDKLVWTELDFTPKAPARLGRRGGAPGGLDMMGTIMKMLGSFLGRSAQSPARPRVFLGIGLKDGEENPVVASVLASGPAGKSGLKAGDVITHFKGRSVQNSEDVHRFARKLSAGDQVTLTISRGKESREVTFTAGKGL
jgi:serine protease DegQ